MRLSLTSIRARRVAGGGLAALLVTASCAGRDAPPPPPRLVPSPPTIAKRSDKLEPLPDATALVADAGNDATDADAALAAPQYPGRTEGCPDGMLRVEGEYCPAPLQLCQEHMNDLPPPAGAERCARYKEPSTCVLRPVHKSFCMDRFEYPNKPGEYPKTLVNYADAVTICKGEGKRLCTVEEFNFACEGPEMLPYTYGYVRDSEKCNIDKQYRLPDHSRRMLRWDECFKDATCKAEFERLDQRLRIGEKLSCVSWAGVYDLNGNVNEWVRRTDKWKYPDRGGLKGGWWGPVRNRCRPTHTTHNEEYWGYEVGVRCCKDAAATHP